MLEVKGLTVKYNSRAMVDNVSFSIEPGQWVMLVGPNGAGKSTIVNAISRGVAFEGAVMFEGVSTAQMKPDRLARNIGVLTQSHQVGYGFTVAEVVALGRYSHRGGAFGGGDHHSEMVEQALEITGMLPYREQSVLTLSGGELQRTFLAQVFAQDPRLLILDEPANHLDPVYQKQIFQLIRRWLEQPGRAVLSVVHDLGLARRYGSHALLLNSGRLVGSGPLEAVLTRERLQEVYRMDVYSWIREQYSQWMEE